MGVTAEGLVAKRGSFVLGVPAFVADASGTAVLGPNGAGKTTLLLALHGLISRAGTVARPARAAAVFARPAVLRGPVLWNVSAIASAGLGIANHEAEIRARRLLHDVGLESAFERDARTLSTGERQRLAIARALSVEPQALFLDEPLANVDADGRPQLRSLLRAYAERADCALVLATSSLFDARELCSRAVVLRAGHVVHDGPVAEAGSAGDPFVSALLAETR